MKLTSSPVVSINDFSDISNVNSMHNAAQLLSYSMVHVQLFGSHFPVVLTFKISTMMSQKMAE
jgi:hypothetical protein